MLQNITLVVNSCHPLAFGPWVIWMATSVISCSTGRMQGLTNTYTDHCQWIIMIYCPIKVTQKAQNVYNPKSLLYSQTTLSRLVYGWLILAYGRNWYRYSYCMSFNFHGGYISWTLHFKICGCWPLFLCVHWSLNFHAQNLSRWLLICEY